MNCRAPQESDVKVSVTYYYMGSWDLEGSMKLRLTLCNDDLLLSLNAHQLFYLIVGTVNPS